MKTRVIQDDVEPVESRINRAAPVVGASETEVSAVREVVWDVLTGPPDGSRGPGRRYRGVHEQRKQEKCGENCRDRFDHARLPREPTLHQPHILTPRAPPHCGLTHIC